MDGLPLYCLKGCRDVLFTKKPILLFFAFALVITACSAPSSSDGGGDQANKSVQKAPVEAEEILKAEPGKYGGDRYDKQKVEEALKQFPDDLSADEAYDRLHGLLASDYRSLYKKLDNFDTSLRVTEARPDGPQTDEGETPDKQLNVAILLDASGSMAGQVSGGVKMDLAKEAIQDFASNLPEGANVSLRVYGHKGSNSQEDKKVSCKSNEVVYPLDTYQERGFEQALDQFKPTGWTPLAAAIESAQKDLQAGSDKNAQNIVYVVSDGIETCGGDPVAVAKKLNQSDIQAVVNIIGFDVDDDGQKALKKVADAGGGSYDTVQSKEDLERKLKQEYDRLRLEWHRWDGSNRLSVLSQRNDKLKQLWDLKSDFYDLVKKEKKHFIEARKFLDNHNKLKNDEVEDQIRERFEKREDTLQDYIEKKDDEIDETLEQNKNELQKKIKEEADKNEEKYDNS